MKRLLALGGALLCLCSCASMLEREYTVTADHIEKPAARGDTAYRVDTYPALTSALLSYAEEGMDAGVLHFPTTYPGDLTVDLEKARRQLLEEDPLGNYALEDVSFHISKIIAYYEAELTFTYKVDRSELISLPKAAGQTELAELLKDTLAKRDARLAVYLTHYPEGDDAFFTTALELARAPQPPEDAPDPEPSASGEPAEREPAPAEAAPVRLASTRLYPKTGSRRVAVLELEYLQPEIRPADEPEDPGEEASP